MLWESYLHPSGRIPAYEWNFSDVNSGMFGGNSNWRGGPSGGPAASGQRPPGGGELSGTKLGANRHRPNNCRLPLASFTPRPQESLA
jgi:hypothetical protein